MRSARSTICSCATTGLRCPRRRGSVAGRRARFVHNTIWNAKDGGLWLRAGTGRRVVPTDTLLLGNLAQSIKLVDGADAAHAAGNVLRCPPAGWIAELPPGTTRVPSAGFVDEPGHDLRLLPGSPVRELAGAEAPPAGAR